MPEPAAKTSVATYRLVSADSPVNQPPDLFSKRVPPGLLDRAPRVERFDEGDAWLIEGVSDPINFGMNACAGLPPEEMMGWAKFEDIRRGGWDPLARLLEMDRDGVDAEVLYPTPRLANAIIANPDREYHVAMIRAYNDWLADYCKTARDRRYGIPLARMRRA